MRRLGLTFALTAAIALGGCAGLRQNLAGRVGENPQPAAPTFYAAVDGLRVYAKSSASSQVVGHLGLHEKVTRPRLEHGYAYIVTEKGGLEGWVDNAQLLWRIPATDQGSVPGENEPARGDVQAPAATGAMEPVGVKDSDSVRMPEPAPPSQPEHAPQPTPASEPAAPAKPSHPAPPVFDPF